jgi:hypothetical protein
MEMAPAFFSSFVAPTATNPQMNIRRKDGAIAIFSEPSGNWVFPLVTAKSTLTGSEKLNCEI